MNKKAFTQPLRARAGFTLFEIIIAMLVVGILSALAVPKVVDLVNEARRGDELNTVGNVRSGIALTYLGNVTRGITPQYPQNLDNATLAKASPTNPVYDLVLQHGITKSWEKLEPLRYRGPTGQEYEYDPTDGTFEAVAALPPPPPSLITWAYPGTQIASGGLVANNVATQVLEALYITSDVTSDLLVGVADLIEGTPATLWQDGVYGEAGYDGVYSIKQTSDGGYLLAGYTDSFGEEMGAAYLVKIDAYGNLEWSKTYAGSVLTSLSDFLETPDGYIILGGMGSFITGDVDYLVSKIDSTGTLQWSKTYGGSGYDYSGVLLEDLDGNYLITGITNSFAGWYDTNLTKIDSGGNLLWSKTYGGSNVDYNVDNIQQTTDGGYIMASTTRSFGAGGMDQALIKVNSDGTIQWAKTYGGGSNDAAFSVVETPDGYMISGWTTSFGPSGWDNYINKVDLEGNLEWSKRYDKGFGEEWGIESIQQASDGNYIISSSSQVDPNDLNNVDFYLAKIDPNGTILWDKTYGGTADFEGVWDLALANDGGYIMVGDGYSFGSGNGDFYTIKTDSDGNVIP